ncbi:MAG: hypothetical protein ABI222_01575, partial [Opitutaceae bacterium]
ATSELHAQYARGQLIPEVKLKNGTVLHDVTVVAVGSTTVTAKWAGGRGSLALAQLPPDMRAALTPAASSQAASAPVQSSVSAAPANPQLASAELPTDIKLTNGYVMHRSTVARWETNSVLVSYPGGIVSVRFNNMAPEHRAIFEARRDEALARQAKEDANTAVGQDTANQDEKNKQTSEASAHEAAEAKAEEIQKGLAYHFLVKGMTKDQVKQAFGRPVDDKTDIFFYAFRGLDKYGNSADRTLTFTDGLLDSWRDMRDGDPAGAVAH